MKATPADPPHAEPAAHASGDGRVHSLHDHLIATAGLAGNFAAQFGCREWGYLAGLWHDVGVAYFRNACSATEKQNYS